MQYIEHSVTHPTDPEHEGNLGLVDHARAALQRQARERGQSLAEPDGEPEVVSVINRGPIETDEGPVEVTTTTWRMAVVDPPEVLSGAVQATEREDGTWEAKVPFYMPVVSVKHGLDSYDVVVTAFDPDGDQTGFHGFMPVGRDEVDVMPGSGNVERVLIALVPEEPAASPAADEPVVASQSQAVLG